MRFKTIYKGKVVEVEPRIDFREDNDGEATVYDSNGEVIDTVRIHGWNLEYPYAYNPLYFIPLDSLTTEQRFQLIKQFETWYGDTDQNVSTWAVEFELIVRMLCHDNGALIVNPMFLKMDNEMYQIISDIIWPSMFTNVESKEAAAEDKPTIGNTDNVLENPFSMAQMIAMISEDNMYIEGLVLVDQYEMLENDIEGFLDLLSERMTNSSLLMDINYNPVRVLEDGRIVMKVSGDISEILDTDLTYDDEALEKIKAVILNAGSEAILDFTGEDPSGYDLKEFLDETFSETIEYMTESEILNFWFKYKNK